MAEDFLKRSTRFLKEASLAVLEGDYAMCVRRSQECVEMSPKGVLRLLGIEYPSKHDVSDVLLTLDRSSLPDWFKEQLSYLARSLCLSRVLDQGTVFKILVISSFLKPSRHSRVLSERCLPALADARETQGSTSRRPICCLVLPQLIVLCP